MIEKPKSFVNYKTLLIALTIGLFFFLTGMFGGYKYAKKQETLLIDTFSYKIDSIHKVIQVYQDSLTALSVKDQQQIVYITKWKTRYDTIRPKEDIDDLLKGLNEIGKTNPE